MQPGRLADLPQTFGPYGSMPTTGIVARIQDWSLLGHEFIHGLLFLQAHTAAGHASFKLGENSQRGFWLFYPVGLLVKTPILTLISFVAGCVLRFTSPMLRNTPHLNQCSVLIGWRGEFIRALCPT